MAETKAESSEGLSGSVKAFSDGIAALTSIPRELIAFLADQTERRSNNIRPNYPAAADAFAKIAEDIRLSIDKILKFVNEAVDLRQESVTSKRLDDFVAKYRDANSERIARDLKIKCSEIDSKYDEKTKAWYKEFLGIRNTYAENIIKQKGQSADKLLQTLTEIDSVLIRGIVDQIVTPLRRDVEQIVATSDRATQRRLHSEMQARYRTLVATLEDDLRRLDDAVLEFRKLASQR